MKKLLLLLSAFALVIGLSQCSKPNLPVINPGGTQHVVLNASWDNGGSKIEQVGAGLKWKEGDKLTVSGGATGELTCTNVANGTFEGEITKGSGEKITFTFQSANYKENFREQTGALNDAVLLKSEELEYKSDGNYGEVSMTMPHEVLMLDLSGFAATTKTGETTVTISINGSVKASVANITSDPKAVYVAIPADETPSEKVYTFNANGVVASAPWPLKTNTFYTKKGEGGTPTGESVVIVPTAPVFSVAASRTVVFSKGNLWYDGSKFHFENSQTEYSTTWDASHVGLFRWSTKKDDAVSSSTLHMQGVAEDVFFTNSQNTVASGSFRVDGEEAGTWRNLSSYEMEYLLNTGNDLSGARTDANRFALAKVNGVNGLLIFPDKYNNGTAVSGITGVAAVNNVVDVVDFPDDNIPAETWTTMESCGVVFLPAAGSRDGKVFKDGGSGGSYWLSAGHDANNGRCMRFYKTDGKYKVNCMGNLREHGYSVRLVR